MRLKVSGIAEIKIFRGQASMNIFKTSFYSAISQATSLFVGLISVKIVAREIGPEGVAMQGQFINATAMILIFATGAIGQGVIKYLAEHASDNARKLQYIRTAFSITLFSSIVMGLITICGAHLLSENSFKTTSYSSAYWLYGIFLPFTALNSLFNYILNGLKKIAYLTAVNITTSVINLVLVLLLTREYHVYGVLVSATFASILIFGLNIFLLGKYKWFTYKEIAPLIDKKVAIQLLKFSTMSLLAGFGAPLAQMLIRDRLIDRLGFDSAGQWQTVSRISDFYLSFIVSVLSIYFMPKLSELVSHAEIRKEIYKTAVFVFPIVITTAFIIFLSRDLIIKYLLTEKFHSVRNLFHFQFLGDVFKVGGWLLSNLLWAKAMTRKYLIVDGLSLLLYVLITFVCIHFWGLIGATIGFALAYLLYFIVMIIVNRKYLV